MNTLTDAYLKVAFLAINSKQSFEDFFKLNESIDTIINHIDALSQEHIDIYENKNENEDVDPDIMQYIHVAKAAIESGQSFEEFFQLTESIDRVNGRIDEVIALSMHPTSSILPTSSMHPTTSILPTSGVDMNMSQIVSTSYSMHPTSSSMHPTSEQPAFGELEEEEYILMKHQFLHGSQQYWIDEHNNLYNDYNEKIGIIVNTNTVIFN
jgi:hypothetical protein